jgi:16S rRNA pseudouridine516 synthase
MSLIRYLARLGYGTRRDVTSLLADRRVTDDTGRPIAAADPWGHDALRIDGQPLDPPPGAVLALHKPVGYVCSGKDLPPLVYDLLPSRMLLRTPVVAPVGRLDRDSSGLLILTDDGALNHRLTSPRAQHTKTYRCTLQTPLTGDEHSLFSSGTLMLRGETRPLAPVLVRSVNAETVELTLTEGRYHQIRRMFAAVGNHVTALHRTHIGAFALGDLSPGAWRVLTADDVVALHTIPALPPAP